LAGQQYDYLVSNLHEYANRMKNHSMLGMRAVAILLDDDSIKALASYLSSLDK
jgi:cytochrome c553